MSINALIKQEVNDEQYKAVINMDNCVVAAGAGSGKTRVLAYRYAHLVLEYNYPVESILTLTFTKKATAEMFSRIYKTLKDIKSSEKSTPEEKRRARKAIEEFHTARIQTIDSFCANIVRLASRQYGIRPDFTIDNDVVNTFCYKTAREFILKYRNNPYLQEINGNGSLEWLTDKLFSGSIAKYSNIANPIDFLAGIPKQIAEIIKEWQSCYEKIIDAKNNFEDEYYSYQELFDRVENNYLDKTTITQYFNTILDTHIPETEKQILTESVSHSVKEYMKGLQELLAIPKKRITKDHKYIIDDLKELYPLIAPLAQYILYFSQTAHLIPLLEEYQTTITEWKRLTGKLTYSDVANLALKILIENPEIRKSEKLKTNAIMIDEFQDNNSLQKDMLFLLAEKENRMEKSVPIANELCPNKLFFVGDEKQSIYKFRGADVSVFRKLKNEIPNNLTLSKNYRSHPQLISGFNTFFGGYEYNGGSSSQNDTNRIANSYSVFIQDHQLVDGVPLPIFEAEYNQAYSKHFETDQIETKDDKRIHFCLLNNSTKEKNQNGETEDTEDLTKAENIAIFTAEKISHICKNTYKPNDIAILFRAYSDAALYEKHLRRLGIPYTTESITNFFGDAPINDITAYIRLLMYPHDTMAYTTVLCSPFVGISQQEALSCILQSEQNSKETVLFSLENSDSLLDSAKDTYIKGLERYNTLRNNLQNSTCTNLVNELWYNHGYRFETMWNKDVSLFSELYDYLFEISRSIDSEGKNISYFADYLLELQVNNERLDDVSIPIERDGAVQIMSIHKSKGLEFPVVFVASVEKKGKPDTNELSLYIDKEYGTTINFPPHPDIADYKMNYFYTKSRHEEKLMSEAELRRVLYVAMTRAEKELYITASFKLTKDVQKELSEKLREDIVQSTNTLDIEKKLYAMLDEMWKYTANKEQNDKSVVKNKYCRESDNYFSFLLPLLAYYKNTDAPFTLEEIKNRTQEELRIFNSQKKITKQEVYNSVKSLYENAEIIETPMISSRYKTPSHLSHKKDSDFQKNDNYDNGAILLPELDAIIKEQVEEGFDYSHFGTIAHAYVETIFTHQEASIPAQIIHKLTTPHINTIKKIAQTLADNFASSDLGKESLSSKWQKTEYSFKYLLKNTANKTIINGSIDLLFEKSDGTLVIVDYKTDSVQDCSIHLAQLAAYQQAVSKIFSKQIDTVKCYLFYLRTATAVDISKDCLNVDLKDFIE